ncbi:hypothetical protein ABFX02_11G104400 [Erythranthe guttata]
MLDKNNSENKGNFVANNAALFSPRISFSTEFMDSSSSSHNNNNNNNNNSHSHVMKRAAAEYRDAPVSSDFEFSVGNFSTISDELVSKGKLLPYKGKGKATTTLREELQNNEDESPKNPTRSRGFLGLRKSHIGSKNKSVITKTDSKKSVE